MLAEISPGQYWDGINCLVACVKHSHSLQAVPSTKLNQDLFLSGSCSGVAVFEQS